VMRALRETALALGAAGVRLVQGDALEFLRDPGAHFDVVFLDPPYRLGLTEKILALLSRSLAPQARVYVENDAPIAPPPGWIVLRRGRAGQVHYHLLGREADDQGGLSGNV